MTADRANHLRFCYQYVRSINFVGCCHRLRLVNETNSEGVFVQQPTEIYRERIGSFWGKLAGVATGKFIAKFVDLVQYYVRKKNPADTKL